MPLPADAIDLSESMAEKSIVNDSGGSAAPLPGAVVEPGVVVVDDDEGFDDEPQAARATALTATTAHSDFFDGRFMVAPPTTDTDFAFMVKRLIVRPGYDPHQRPPNT